MAYQFGGLTLANVGDIVTQTSVSTNFQTVLRNSAGPAAPVLSGGDTYKEGQFWYNTTTKVLGQWDGTSWVGVGGGATFSGTPPVLPQTGDLWYDSVTTGRMYIWNGTAWVDASPAAGASVVTTGTGAPTPTTIGFNSQGAMYADISVVPNDIYISDGLGVWDLAGGGGGAAVSAAAPTVPAPAIGDLWYDTVANQLKVYDGANWDSSAATTPYGATAPTAPVAGDLWYDTNAPATLKVYNGTAWTSASGTFEALSDVDVTAKVSLESGIMWDATAVQSGVTGQWVPNQIYDASPTGGASNDF